MPARVAVGAAMGAAGWRDGDGGGERGGGSGGATHAHMQTNTHVHAPAHARADTISFLFLFWLGRPFLLIWRVVLCKVAHPSDLSLPRSAKSLILYGRGWAGSLNRERPLLVVVVVRAGSHSLWGGTGPNGTANYCASKVSHRETPKLREG